MLIVIVIGAGLLASGVSSAAPPFAFDFGGDGTAPPGRLGAVGGDLAVDSDGNVWAEDRDANRVVKYGFDGTFIAEFTQPEGLAAPLDDTQGLGADNAGGVYIVDGGGVRVVKLDPGGRVVRIYGTAPSSGGGDPAPLVSASDVGVGADGTVHVVEAGRIARYRQDGSKLPDVVLPPTVADGRDLAIAPTGDYYLNTASRIVRLSPAGAEIDGIAVFLGGEGIAVDSSGPALRVYGKSTLQGVVEEYAANLTQTGTLTSASGPARVDIPTGIGVDCRGTVYLLDRSPAGARIVKFDDPATPPPPCAPPPPPSGAVDTQINDIDVTQGVQADRDYTPQDSPAGPRTRTFSPDPGSAEVPMRAGGKTVVRVYANLRAGPAGGIANIPATLTGATTAGRRLGTIMPDASPAVLRAGDARVEPSERTDTFGVYTFTLPQEWTVYGRVNLTATVNPAGIGCDEACRRRSTFVLSRVPFRMTTATCLAARVACTDNPYGVDIWPLALRRNGREPISQPQPAFDEARATTPLELRVWGWMGQIEIDDIVTAQSVTTESCFLGIDLGILCDEETKPANREVRQGLLFDRIQRFKQDRNIGSTTVVMGLIGNVHPDLPGANRGKFGDEPNRDTTKGPYGYADITRPLTAVAHELQHALGRRHAGQARDCYPDEKQLGEPWPDFGSRGFLFGYGLDTRAGSGGARTPYRTFAWTAAAPLFDLMSYCQLGDATTWISTIGWNQLISYRAPGLAVPASRQAHAVVDGRPGRLIRVTAVDGRDGRLTITGTSPTRGNATPPDPAARYQLEARDANGVILSSTPMEAEVSSDGVTLLTGAVDAPQAIGQVTVRRGIETATRRRRSAAAPTVRLLLPRPGTRVAGRGLTVVWRSADRDRDRLVATVELSLDGGRSFRPVHVGPSTGRVVVPTARLGDSRNARIRIRVDDGFNEAQATSGRLAIVGPPPVARIVSPARGQRVRADAPLRLSAEATATGGRPLRSQAFRWFQGRRALGRGSTRVVTGLRPGRHAIRLVVTDGFKTTTVTVPVNVTAVRPAFLRLDPPRRLSRMARGVRLRIASTVAATLIAGGKRFAVGPTPRLVVVPVRAGRTPLRLTVRLRAGGLETRQTLTIPRR